ncbi:TPA_asm: adenain+ [Capsaspora MELD virus 1]|nr:TPA_asm: adenain+ [Capsaspora MELD virus 1]
MKVITNFDFDDRYADDDRYGGTFSKDTLPKTPEKKFYFINMADDKDAGTHWVHVDNRFPNVFYFDSFGVDPPEEILAFMKKTKKKMELNIRRIQDMRSVYCGYFCMYMVDEAGKDRDFIDILNDFSDDLKENDKMMENVFVKEGAGFNFSIKKVKPNYANLTPEQIANLNAPPRQINPFNWGGAQKQTFIEFETPHKYYADSWTQQSEKEMADKARMLATEQVTCPYANIGFPNTCVYTPKGQKIRDAYLAKAREPIKPFANMDIGNAIKTTFFNIFQWLPLPIIPQLVGVLAQEVDAIAQSVIETKKQKEMNKAQTEKLMDDKAWAIAGAYVEKFYDPASGKPKPTLQEAHDKALAYIRNEVANKSGGALQKHHEKFKQMCCKQDEIVT